MCLQLLTQVNLNHAAPTGLRSFSLSFVFFPFLSFLGGLSGLFLEVLFLFFFFLISNIAATSLL